MFQRCFKGWTRKKNLKERPTFLVWSNFIWNKWCNHVLSRGQMKSECIYEIIDFPKYQRKNLINICPESLFWLGMLRTHLSQSCFENNQNKSHQNVLRLIMTYSFKNVITNFLYPLVYTCTCFLVNEQY